VGKKRKRRIFIRFLRREDPASLHLVDPMAAGGRGVPALMAMDNGLITDEVALRFTVMPGCIPLHRFLGHLRIQKNKLSGTYSL
jgi:hypothetical protein